jgi:hypothetical protein
MHIRGEEGAMMSRVLLVSLLIVTFLSTACMVEAGSFQKTELGRRPAYTAGLLVSMAICQYGAWYGVTPINAPIYPYPPVPATIVTLRQMRVAASLSLLVINHLSAREARRLLPAFRAVEDEAALRYTNRGMVFSEEFDANHVRTALVQDVLFRKETLPWLERQSIYYRHHR